MSVIQQGRNWLHTWMPRAIVDQTELNNMRTAMEFSLLIPPWFQQQTRLCYRCKTRITNIAWVV